MKVYYQTNNNDCGIAVTQSLIKYFLKKDVSKDQLYQDANIREEGLSILDLELLNEKYGIRLQSYSMSFEEFTTHKTDQYFLLVIEREGEQHYTIAKKKGNGVILYDPALGKVKLTFEKLKSIWLDIFITIDLINNDNKSISLDPTLKRNKVDLFKISSLFLVNLVVLLLSFVNAYLVKYSFNHVYSNHVFYDLVKVLLVNVVFCAVFYFGEFLESILVFKHKIQYFQGLYSKLLDTLKNKKNTYFQKLGKNQFLLLKDHIDYIATYHSEYINKKIISIFTLVIASGLLLYVSYYFIIILVLSAVFQFYFWRKTEKTNKKYIPIISNLQNEGKRLFISLEKFLKNEVNASKLSTLITKSKNNWVNEASNQSEIYLKQTTYSKVNSFINNCLYVLVFASVAYFIILGELNFGHLMVMNLLYMHLNKSLSNLIYYYAFRSKYLYSKEIYQQLLNIDTFTDTNKRDLWLPTRIWVRNLFFAVNNKIIFSNLNLEIKPNTLICGPSGAGKSVLYKLLVKKINPSFPAIFFDDQDTNNIDSSVFKHLCIYQVSDSYTDLIDLDPNKFTFIEPEIKNEIFNICTLINLNPNLAIANVDQLSSGQRQFINLLSLLHYRNKIIFLDEVASHINVEARILVYKHLVPFLARANFVVCSEHTPDIIPLFDNVIHLCPN